MATKKVILFIVEGITDKNSLSLILSRLISSNHIAFHVVGGDTTTNNYTTIMNCITKINDELNKFLKENKFRKSDILKIVHLIDTDGVYINEKQVIEENVSSIIYNTDSMLTRNSDLTVDRNNKKASILNKLNSTSTVSNIEYRMYYFSCNLEHVLHNQQNLDDNLKDEYADDFVDKYDGKESEFKDFMMHSGFSVSGNYKETWNFIKQGNNSLNRYCNLGVFFNDEFE